MYNIIKGRGEVISKTKSSFSLLLVVLAHKCEQFRA